MAKDYIDREIKGLKNTCRKFSRLIQENEKDIKQLKETIKTMADQNEAYDKLRLKLLEIEANRSKDLSQESKREIYKHLGIDEKLSVEQINNEQLIYQKKDWVRYIGLSLLGVIVAFNLWKLFSKYNFLNMDISMTWLYFLILIGAVISTFMSLDFMVNGIPKKRVVRD
jgi:hypothetical protein